MKTYKSSLKHSLYLISASLLFQSAAFGAKTECVSFYGATQTKKIKKKGADWPSYTGDNKGSQYSALRGINKSNVTKVKPLFRWTSPDMELLKANPNLYTMTNQAKPIAINGDLYVSTSASQVVKIDGITGKTIWEYNSGAHTGDVPPNLGFVHRGVSFWESKDKSDQRILFGTGDAYLIALDANTGKPISTFGENGKVDLLKGFKRDGQDWPDRWQYGVTSPVSVVRDTLIIGSSVGDIVKDGENPPGDVRGFDVVTGEMRWRFKTIPQKGDYGNETWLNGSAEKNGQANVWTIMSVDKKRGLVYLPISTPTNDFYGGNRPGDGLFAESLVCVNCKTGQRKWHYQLVHHGLWDYDLPAAPNLFRVNVDGKMRDVVAVVTKQGFTYTFDRVTGEPIWPINETPVIQSLVEESSPTQPIPSKPPAFDRQNIKPEDFLDAEAKAIGDQYIYGDLFTPPTEKTGLGNNNGRETKGTLSVPGNIGGASWAGASYHPDQNLLIVTSVTNPHVKLLQKNPDGSQYPYRYALEASGVTGPDGKPYKSPLFKPPFGRVTAIDMSSGTIRWQVPMGPGPKNDPRIQAAVKGTEWEGKDLGWNRRGHMLLTKDLLFIGQSSIQFPVGLSEKKNAVKVNIAETPGEQNIMVMDPLTGKVLHTIDTMAGAAPGEAGHAQGGLMTYLDKNGNQKIVVPVGGANTPAQLLFLGLTD